ncbi:4-alpha-glucanotransferase [Bacillus massiliigorillae]|uniref:4-alpha-glucanotransferase n=1 Tax=Bacillus massiliigorillae TaxID=1243664 RepID=UPI0003A2B123|nr:4-alpha-glucanotransferase [Bacillus massiliigorillae]
MTYLSKISFTRTAGALLPVFSLPGSYGIGVLGKEARAFADFLLASGIHCWQVLPMVHAGAGNSPYSGISAFAGDPLYIDPETLYEKSLITKEELEDACYPLSSYSVDYDWLLKHKPLLLKKAYSRLTTSMKEDIEHFKEENKYWLNDYALFMTIQEKGESIISKAFLSKEKEEALINDEVFSYYCFLQYEFYSQWQNLKNYCNSLGIGLIGDLPFYVSHDSSDVWANPHLFMLNKDFEAIGIAGTPPDYFSEKGQCWGNPLYDWNAMKGEGYDWWIHRIAFHVKYNDALRIDHFRGFERYWYISAENRDARLGRWEEGPGLSIFHAFEKKYGPAPIIAEDLGTVDERLFAFLKESGFPGMKVLQFAFDGNTSNLHLPHTYNNHSVAYTGTHDNNTTLGWVWEIDESSRNQALEYCNIPSSHWGDGGSQSPVCRGLLRTLYQSVSSIAIAPVQDSCGYGEDTRINIPGKATGNWNFRFTEENFKQIDQEYLLKLSNIFGRNNAFKFEK